MNQTSRLTTLTALCGATLVIGLGGCGDDGGKAGLDTAQPDVRTAPELTTVTTRLDVATIDAGAQTSVTCVGLDQYGEPYAEALSLQVLDSNGQAAEGVTVSGQSITVTHAGVYQVSCYFGGTPRIDDLSPPSLTVLAGSAASIQTNLFLVNLTAGDTVSVSCTVKDANGNAATADTTVKVTPATAGTSVNGRSVTFTDAGSFGVVCQTVDGSLVGTDTITVTVTPGKVKLLQTVLSPDTITPGQPVSISCPGEDAWGNPQMLEQVHTLPTEGVDFLDDTRLSITSTVSGTYDIACKPREAWRVDKVESISALLTVLPGTPTTLTLDMAPERDVYNVGAKVTLTPRLTDDWGNPTPEVGDGLQTEARLGGTLDQTIAAGDKVDFHTEGFWQLRVDTGPPENLSVVRGAVVDASAPTIDITYPARGAMITTTGGPITIQGTVIDKTGGLASVSFNGAPQAVAQGTNSWPINIPFSPRHGLNSIVMEAIDTNGNRVRIAQSFMAAPAWTPLNQRYDDGLIVHLADDFIDDGGRIPPADDLATLFLGVINGIDIAGFIPSPVVSYAGYDVFLKNLEYQELLLELIPVEGEIIVKLKIPNLEVDVDADGFIDVSGTVTTDAIDIEMGIGLDVTNGVPKATALATVVQFQNLDINVHWSINWLIDLFTKRIEDAIAGSFEDALKQQLPPMLERVLKDFEIAQGFQMPAFLPGMEPVTINLEAKPYDVDLSTDGLDLDLRTQVSTLKRVPWSAPGSIARGGCFGTSTGRPVWAEDKRLALALNIDVLNRILFGVWWGGALELEIPASQFGDLSAYGASDLSVTVSGRMPPILTDCNGPDLEIHLGELAVDASLKLGQLQLAVGLIVAFDTTASIGASNEGALTISLGDIDLDGVVIDIVSVDSDLFDEDDEDSLIQLLREQMLATLLQDLAGASLGNFPLPEIDLGGISDDLEGQTFGINNMSVERERGFFVVQGDP